MVKGFAALMVLLLSAMTLAALHAQRYDHEGRRAQLETFSGLTTLPGVSLSRAYYEVSPYAYGTHSLNSYVELPPIDSMDYVYAR